MSKNSKSQTESSDDEELRKELQQETVFEKLFNHDEKLNSAHFEEAPLPKVDAYINDEVLNDIASQLLGTYKFDEKLNTEWEDPESRIRHLQTKVEF